MNLNDFFSSDGTGISLVAALGPVLAFLGFLFFFDTFRLVRPRRIVWAIAAGIGSGLACYFVNSSLLGILGWPVLSYAVLLAPIIEETIKGSYLGWLLHRRKVGFLVDTAILGFATGSGFALAENVFYLKNLPDAPLFVWIIRGFGTAIMHGGATAIFAISVRAVMEVGHRFSARGLLPGLAAAILIHSVFNRMLGTPVVATLLIMIIVPALMWLVYRVGEKRLRLWLGQGFDRDTELLALINDGQVRETPLGRYLISLRGSFRPELLADMLCLLRLQAELSIRAKGILLLREHGLKPHPDPELEDKLTEVKFLEKSLGKTGMLALRPVCRWQGNDQWQRHLLDES